MPRRHPRRFCKSCGEHRDTVGPLSAIGLCQGCGERNLKANVEGLRTHSGPAFHRWRRAMAASVGGLLVDDLLGGEDEPGGSA